MGRKVEEGEADRSGEVEKGEGEAGEVEEKGRGREEERRRVKCGSGCWIGARPLARLLAPSSNKR